ncbi:MAG: hypothetical protein LUH46_02745 [Alistipes sp.]|nr:hypothetical protein [Alistipes sp.]
MNNLKKYSYKTHPFDVERKIKLFRSKWKNEKLLLQMIEDLFSSEKVLFHHRPSWLNGLELDIFIPSIRLGIKYQGEQQYRPMQH